MAGLVQRCAACGAEMVIDRRHRGLAVPCPGCGAAAEVPQNLDFRPIETDTALDRERAAWLLGWTIFTGLACCLPACAFICWSASGSIRRARDAGREVDPLLASTRAVAAAFAAIDGAVWILMTISWAAS